MTHEETPADSAEAHVPSGSDYVSDRDFADFPISAELLQGIHEHGYKTSTPVQAETIDPAIAGRDLLVRAKTGTGKTAAFCVPILELIPAGAREATGVILAPTRELAQQIAEEAESMARHRGIGVATLVGGVPMGPQIKALEAGAALIVGTPGRILDHIGRGNLNLKTAKVACLDEADEMLSMGFYQDVTGILDATMADRQVLLFSATISPETQRLCQKYLKDEIEIRLSTDTDHVEGITHILYDTDPQQHKVRTLLYILDVENPDAAIIFCNTREDAATVASYLDRQGLDAQLISGELPQSQRSRVMKRVKAGEVRFLVATDVASRGIDISDLTHVVNYALPKDPSVYMHRIGRTGRIGKEGTAISLVGGADLNTRRVLERDHKVIFERQPLPDSETAIRARVERQAGTIKAAMGKMVFESYLPTVRALLERPDGEALLAASLRAFFQWDRRRRALAAGIDLEAEEQERREHREAKAERRAAKRGGGRGRGGRDGGRGGRDGGRGGRDGGRGGRDGGRGGRDGNRGGRSRDEGRRSDKPAASTDDLDALLSSDAAPEPKKRKRSRGSKKKSDTSSSDLDALLSED
ncbi:MAG: DEAD/DEAH box helicase [Proteobacteria bacterium]|nr:DEAD/DEAH box helicase [Pseudomonadota bacterium]